MIITNWDEFQPRQLFRGWLSDVRTPMAPDMRGGRWRGRKVDMAFFDARTRRPKLPRRHPLTGHLVRTQQVGLLPYLEGDPHRPAFSMRAADSMFERMDLDDPFLERVLFIAARSNEILQWAEIADRTIEGERRIFALGESVSFKLYARGPFDDD